MNEDNVTPIDLGRKVTGGNGNGPRDNEHEIRIRKLEQNYVGLKKDISWIKETMANKQDISNLKVWILSGVLGGIGVAAGIAATVVKAFF